MCFLGGSGFRFVNIELETDQYSHWFFTCTEMLIRYRPNLITNEQQGVKTEIEMHE